MKDTQALLNKMGPGFGREAVRAHDVHVGSKKREEGKLGWRWKMVNKLVFREEEEKLGLPRRGEKELVEWAAVLALKPVD